MDILSNRVDKFNEFPASVCLGGYSFQSIRIPLAISLPVVPVASFRRGSPVIRRIPGGSSCLRLPVFFSVRFPISHELSGMNVSACRGVKVLS
jgi:hypothetical protein